MIPDSFLGSCFPDSAKECVNPRMAELVAQAHDLSATRPEVTYDAENGLSERSQSCILSSAIRRPPLNLRHDFGFARLRRCSRSVPSFWEGDKPMLRHDAELVSAERL